MKKIVLVTVLGLFAINAYPFWIWSPKTKKWENPQYSPLPTPKLQFKKAIEEFKAKKYKSALKEFQKIVLHYPDAREAAEAQYYLGRCWEELKNPYQAFLAYQKVIDSYPNSKRTQEIIEREYNIGEYFLNREPKKWLGISLYDLVEHPSIEIFTKIVESAPYSPYASRAQYKLGILLAKLGRYEEAKKEFEKLLDNYPDSEWAEAAKFQLAMVSAKVSYGAEYDGTYRKEAMRGLKEFLEKHPQAKLSQEAERQLKILKEEEAKKNFDIARFYEKQKKIKSAVLYYRIVVENFSDTTYAEKAKEALERLKE